MWQGGCVSSCCIAWMKQQDADKVEKTLDMKNAPLGGTFFMSSLRGCSEEAWGVWLVGEAWGVGWRSSWMSKTRPHECIFKVWHERCGWGGAGHEKHALKTCFLCLAWGVQCSAWGVLSESCQTRKHVPEDVFSCLVWEGDKGGWLVDRWGVCWVAGDGMRCSWLRM